MEERKSKIMIIKLSKRRDCVCDVDYFVDFIKCLPVVIYSSCLPFRNDFTLTDIQLYQETTSYIFISSDTNQFAWKVERAPTNMHGKKLNPTLDLDFSAFHTILSFSL